MKISGENPAKLFDDKSNNFNLFKPRNSAGFKTAKLFEFKYNSSSGKPSNRLAGKKLSELDCK